HAWSATTATRPNRRSLPISGIARARRLPRPDTSIPSIEIASANTCTLSCVASFDSSRSSIWSKSSPVILFATVTAITSSGEGRKVSMAGVPWFVVQQVMVRAWPFADSDGAIVHGTPDALLPSPRALTPASSAPPPYSARARRTLHRHPARGSRPLCPAQRAAGVRQQHPGHRAHAGAQGAGRSQLGQAFPAAVQRLRPAHPLPAVRQLPDQRGQGHATAPVAGLQPRRRAELLRLLGAVPGRRPG